MEKLIDNNFSDLKENKIIASHCELEWKHSEITFEGKGNVVYFFGKKQRHILLDGTRIICKGNNNLIFICPSKHPLRAVINLGHGCTVYIGRRFYSTIPVHLMANECSYIHIGEDNLFARDIWLRTSDMHMIYDIETKKRINSNKSIFLGKHVWVGQDVSCLKGTVVGDGSVVGYGSLLSGKKTIEVNTIYAGRPAKELRKGIMWKWKGCNQVTEEEFLEGVYDETEELNHVYTDQEMRETYHLFHTRVSSVGEKMEDRISFLIDYTKMNQRKSN